MFESALNAASEKHLRFEIDHAIQGKREPSLMPVGGRHIICVDCIMLAWIFGIVRDDIVSLKGANSQTSWANGQCRRRWSIISASPQWQHLTFAFTPLYSNLAPTAWRFAGRASSLAAW